MFPQTYFGLRFFAKRYWVKRSNVVPSDAGQKWRPDYAPDTWQPNDAANCWRPDTAPDTWRPQT